MGAAESYLSQADQWWGHLDDSDGPVDSWAGDSHDDLWRQPLDSGVAAGSSHTASRTDAVIDFCMLLSLIFACCLDTWGRAIQAAHPASN